MHGHPRTATADVWSIDLIPRHDFPQPVRPLGRHIDSSWFGRRLRPLVGHLGGCTGCNPKNKDRRVTHTKCETLHSYQDRQFGRCAVPNASLPTAPLSRVPSLPYASYASLCTPENWRNCNGRRGSGKESRRSAAAAQSSAEGDNIVRSRCSNPGDSSGDNGQISRLRWPIRWFAIASGTCGSAEDKLRKRREIPPTNSFCGRPERPWCRILDMKVA